jgi:hypothetical protein
VESIRKLLGLTVKERTALDSVLEVLDRSTTYDVGEKVAVAEAVDNRNEMFQQDVADIEAMEVGDSIEAGGEVITKVGEDSFEMEVTPTSKKTGNTEVATFYLNSKRAEARAGDKVRLRDYKVTEVRAQNLRRGDVITNIEDGIRYAYRVKGVFRNKAQGVVFVEVEVLDIGNQPVGEARHMEPGLKFTSFTTDYVVGQNTTLYFKKSKRDGKMDYRPIVQRLENWDAVNREEKAPTVDDVAKRAAVEGVSVEEFTKEQQRVERQRKDTLSREAKRELDGLKGKTDKASKAKRAELKEFMANLGTMSVNEALAKRTEGKLKAREQRASEFSEKRINELGRQGILSHFTQVNFKKFDPSLEKRGFYGGGVYFTTGKQWGTGWTEDDFGTQVAFVDTNKMKILTGSEALSRPVTPEEYNQALAVIKSLTVPGENFTFGSRLSDEQIKDKFLGDAKLVDGELIDYQENILSLGYLDMYMRNGMLRSNFFTRGIQDVVTRQEAREAGAGYLVTPVFKAVYPEYQGKINTTGVDVDSIVGLM